MTQKYRHELFEYWLSTVTHPALQNTLTDALDVMVEHYNDDTIVTRLVDTWMTNIDNQEPGYLISVCNSVKTALMDAIRAYGVQLDETITYHDITFLTRFLKALIDVSETEEVERMMLILSLGNEDREKLADILTIVEPELDENKILEHLVFISSSFFSNLKEILQPKYEEVEANAAYEENRRVARYNELTKQLTAARDDKKISFYPDYSVDKVVTYMKSIVDLDDEELAEDRLIELMHDAADRGGVNGVLLNETEMRYRLTAYLTMAYLDLTESKMDTQERIKEIEKYCQPNSIKECWLATSIATEATRKEEDEQH